MLGLGGMAERFKAAVLKTAEPKGLEGSTPSPSAPTPERASSCGRHPLTVEIAGSNPASGTDKRRRVGWALASLGGRNPPVCGLWRFNSSPRHHGHPIAGVAELVDALT